MSKPETLNISPLMEAADRINETLERIWSSDGYKDLETRDFFSQPVDAEKSRLNAKLRRIFYRWNQGDFSLSEEQAAWLQEKYEDIKLPSLLEKVESLFTPSYH